MSDDAMSLPDLCPKTLRYVVNECDADRGRLISSEDDRDDDNDRGRMTQLWEMAQRYRSLADQVDRARADRPHIFGSLAGDEYSDLDKYTCQSEKAKEEEVTSEEELKLTCHACGNVRSMPAWRLSLDDPGPCQQADDRAKALWQLLDGIDKLEKKAKYYGGATAFQRDVRTLIAERFKHFTSDGHRLYEPGEEPSLSTERPRCSKCEDVDGPCECR